MLALGLKVHLEPMCLGTAEGLKVHRQSVLASVAVFDPNCRRVLIIRNVSVACDYDRAW